MKTFKKVVSVAACLVLLLLLWKLPSWGFLKSEITEYPVMCEVELNYGECPQVSFTMNPTTYKVLADRQEVLYWTHSIDRVERLTKCGVKNRKNWTCKYDDESAEFGFTNGEFYNVTLEGDKEWDKKVFYVSRWRWLKLQASQS